ncbi:SpaA isopeptide-forming pilin-related protein, partial [Bacillus mycoides]|uniref:SpaA isopeptide-forming pilin-related protein n=1 Tax=Bacillus mycoides TaxID=1405 RepID=UPI002112EED6
MKKFLKVLLVLIMFSNALPLNVIKAAQTYGMEYITKVELLDGNGDQKEEFSIHDDVTVKFEWKFPNEKDFSEGDQMIINVPEVLQIPLSVPLEIKESDGTVQAKGVTNKENNTVTLTFTKGVQKSDVSGQLNLSLVWNKEKVETGKPIDVVFTDYKGHIPSIKIAPDPQGTSGPPGTAPKPAEQPFGWDVKKGLSSAYMSSATPDIIYWVVKLNGNMQEIENAKFTDIIEGGHELIENHIQIFKGTWWDNEDIDTSNYIGYDAPKQTEKHKLSIDLGKLEKNEGILIYYETKIVDNFMSKEYKNTAQLTGQNFSEKDDYVYRSKFKIEGNGEGNLGKLKIKKRDADEPNKYLEGAQFKLVEKDTKALVKENITTDKDGSVLVEGLKYRKYELTETKAPEGYELNTEPREIEISENKDNPDKATEVTVENKLMRGSIEVLKVDADKKDKPLAGVEFTLLDKNQTPIGEPKLTDENGKVSFDNLAYGTYYIEETKTIKGYKIKDERLQVDIQNDSPVKRTVTNEVIRGNVELLKVDTENNDVTLEGAEFELRDSNNEMLDTYKTGKDGKIVINNLVFGDYKLIETKAPTGFVLEPTPLTFSVTEEDQTIRLTKENKKNYGDLEITKVDIADENKKLANAKFEIYNATGDKVVEGVTDENGVATFKHLAFGKYTFKEVVAPEGYFIDETVFDFEIREDGEIIQRTVKDEKVPSIKTTATDKADGKKEMHANPTVTIQDEVAYHDLLVGKEYLVKGKLMDKATNQPLLVDGKEVVKEEKLVPTEANGSILLDFTFDATGLEEKEVVVFEDVWYGDSNVATHADIEDKGQTVKFVKPAVQTTATDKADGTKELHTTKSVTIQDNVKYENLVVGKAYTVKGKLMDKATNQPLLVDGKEVIEKATFTAEKKDGFIPLDFTFDATGLEEKEVVVFEDVWYGD